MTPFYVEATASSSSADLMVKSGSVSISILIPSSASQFWIMFTMSCSFRSYLGFSDQLKTKPHTGSDIFSGIPVVWSIPGKWCGTQVFHYFRVNSLPLWYSFKRFGAVFPFIKLFILIPWDPTFLLTYFISLLGSVKFPCTMYPYHSR